MLGDWPPEGGTMVKKRMNEPGTGAGGGSSSSPAPEARAWTFMVYLAGDNNLEDYGRADLLEMKQVGSTPQVALVAQFDRMQAGETKRYYLTQGNDLEGDDVRAGLGETNTGDPRELSRFLIWAMQEYPAKRYALVLWNHGMGWKEDDIYRLAERSGLHLARRQRTLGQLIAQLARCGARPPLFSTTVETILARGIAYDDTDRDFLDNAEMERALGAALLATGVEKLDLLGFDACLMNMIEVAYQVKDVTAYVVGSQENEPAEGWPYERVLNQLVNQPTIEAEQLATLAVEAYAAAYGAEEILTQSALDLAAVREVTWALSELCRYILEYDQECLLALGRAGRKAQSYADADYKDLYDFCSLLAERQELPELRIRAQAVMDLLVPPGQGRLVRAETHQGTRVARSHGVSIYFPSHAISPFYGNLKFANESLWDDMLLRMLGI